MSPSATSAARALRTIAAVISACLLPGIGPASVASAQVPSTQAPAVQRALLTLTVNETPQGEVLSVVRGADVLVDAAALANAGLRNLHGREETIGGTRFVSLSSLSPAVTFRFDELALSLQITAGLEHFGTAVIDLQQAKPAFEYARATSAFLNYGANWSGTAGADGTIETGLSVGGALVQGLVSWDRTNGLTRALTNVVVDQRERLRRWSFGDSLVGSEGFGSGLLIGGIHLAREYSLDPYFVQFPTLGLSGSALTPSTVEVYVNDRLVSRQQVSPGTFNLANVPMPSGTNQTRVVVRDAFGREQQTGAPFYLTTSALARGLHDFDYALGFARAGGAASSWNYGKLTAVARHRYGLTDTVTAGFTAEADPGLVAAGPTVNLRLPLGSLELAASASRSAGRSGGALSAGYAWLGRPLNLSLRLRSMTPGYATLNIRRPEDRNRLEASAMVGAQLSARASVSIQGAYLDPCTGNASARASLMAAVGLAKRVNAFLNASYTSGGTANAGTEVYAGLSLSLGPRTNAGTWVRKGRDGIGFVADTQRSLPMDSGIGYRARATSGDMSMAEAVLEAQGAYGRYELGQEMLNGVNTTHASVSGGIVAIGGRLNPTRPVDGSFALVRVPDVAGVRTYVNNQEAGRTNRRGETLLPNLLPYYANRVSIADQDVPMERDLTSVEQSVGPPYRGGALIVFDAALRQSVVGTVVLESGGQAIIPAFGEMSLSIGNRALVSPIGRGGQFYFEQVPAGAHPAVVHYKDVTCQLTVTVPASSESAVRLGVLRCQAPGGGVR